jgi:hypothetical protein
LDGKLKFYEHGSLLQVTIENHALCFHIRECPDVDPNDSINKFKVNEVQQIETLTQFMGDNQFVDTGFSLSTILKEDDQGKDVYM